MPFNFFLTFWIFRHLVLYTIYFKVGVKGQQLAESSEHSPQILYPTKKLSKWHNFLSIKPTGSSSLVMHSSKDP